MRQGQTGFAVGWKALVAVAAVAILPIASRAAADQVTVKGTVLKGTVTGVSSKSVELQTEYGKGKIDIPFSDIQGLESDGRYHVLYGEEGEAIGRLLGVEDGKLLVGETRANAARIDVTAIQSAISAEKFEGSTLEALRSRYRFWSGSLDLGFSLSQTTVDTTSLSTGVEAERDKSPTRLILGAHYRYATEKKEGMPRSRLEDELRGRIRGEYDLTQRLFAYASGDAQYDAIEHLSVRAVPKLGLGYKLYKSETAFVQVDAGGSWVYERYFGGDTNDYFALAFGAEADAELPYESRFRWRTDYLPAVDNWVDDYLFRTEASLTVPMIAFVNFKVAVLEEYNNRPAMDAARNKLTTTVGLSIAF